MSARPKEFIRRHYVTRGKSHVLFALLLTLLSLPSCRNFGNFWETPEDKEGNVGKTYIVTYSGNVQDSGVPPMDLSNYPAGAVVTVLGNTGSLVKSGFTFTGWNTQSDGLGTDYAGGGTFILGSSNITLYAKWTNLPTYTVTYSGNSQTSGMSPTDSNNYLTGATVTVLNNTGSLVKTGFTFAGWNTLANGLGTDYAGGATFPIGATNVTLYAKWAPTYTVTYSGNSQTSGTPPVDAGNYIQTASVTVLGNTGSLAKTGFAFSGWNTLANGLGTDYAGGATFPMGAANVTLYAKWIPTYTVTYSGNGNDGGSPPIDAGNYITAATVTVLNNTGSLTKTGFSFTGWNTLSNGLGTDYTGGATFGMGGANITLYAKWTVLPTFTVTYSGNANTGGTPPVDGTNYLTAATVTVMGNTGTLIKTGFAFAGWNTLANGLGTDYAPGATFGMGVSNVTLYAKWVMPSVYVATTGGVSISTDGGTSFMNKTTAQGLGSNTVNGVFASGSNIYAATNAGLSVSTDGGTTFSNKTTAQGLGSNTVKGVWAVGGTLYVATFGGLSISTDNGATFVNKTTANGLGNNGLYGVFAVGSNVYAATAGGFSISTDNGLNYSNKTTVQGIGSNTVNGASADGSIIYAANQGGVSFSTDGGASFITKTTAQGLGSNSVNGAVAVGANIYAATSAGLSISTDGGVSFSNKTTAQGLGANYQYGIYVSSGIIYAATQTGLSISTNGGTSFMNKTTAQGLGSNTTNGVYAFP